MIKRNPPFAVCTNVSDAVPPELIVIGANESSSSSVGHDQVEHRLRAASSFDPPQMRTSLSTGVKCETGLSSFDSKSLADPPAFSLPSMSFGQQAQSTDSGHCSDQSSPEASEPGYWPISKKSKVSPFQQPDASAATAAAAALLTVTVSSSSPDMEMFKNAFANCLKLAFLQFGSLHPIGENSKIIAEVFKLILCKFSIRVKVDEKLLKSFGKLIENMHCALYKRIWTNAVTAVGQIGLDVNQPSLKLSQEQSQRVILFAVETAYAQFQFVAQHVAMTNDHANDEVTIDSQGPTIVTRAYLDAAMPMIVAKATGTQCDAHVKYSTLATAAVRSVHSENSKTSTVSSCFSGTAVFDKLGDLVKLTFSEWSSGVRDSTPTK